MNGICRLYVLAEYYKMKIVICGGGVIGASIAYHLAKKGVGSVVIERCEPACAASGKAGGFLARDWCNDYELGPMSSRSFDLHMIMAEQECFKDCEYRRLDTLSVTVKEPAKSSKKNAPRPRILPEWVDGNVCGACELGTTGTTAQVHPYKLTHAMLKAAAEMAQTQVRIGKVEGVMTDETKVTGVKVDGELMEADVVIIALGPWSHLASQWLRLPAINGQRAHSVIVKPPPPGVTPHALFLVYKGADGTSRSPEVYPRPDGNVYLCGMSDQEPLPLNPAHVQWNPDSCKALTKMAGGVSTSLGQAEPLVEQACYLPLSPDGLPLIGKVPGTEGAFVAAGHSCWGILNAPATGEAMAELVVDGCSSTTDLSPFDPARFF